MNEEKCRCGHKGWFHDGGNAWCTSYLCNCPWFEPRLTSERPHGSIPKCIDQHGPTASPPSSDLVHHVIVRKDLPFGVQVAQVTHAAGESATPRPVPGTIAVALHAEDEAHLKYLGDKLSAAEISHCYVWESEDDARFPGQLMAIGILPTRDREKVRKVTGGLPLAK